MINTGNDKNHANASAPPSRSRLSPRLIRNANIHNHSHHKNHTNHSSDMFHPRRRSTLSAEGFNAPCRLPVDSRRLDPYTFWLERLTPFALCAMYDRLPCSHDIDRGTRSRPLRQVRNSCMGNPLAVHPPSPRAGLRRLFREALYPP
jgi:hypothetical protein